MIYKHIETPFGNFAASVGYDYDTKEYTYKCFNLTPLGGLDTVPLTKDSYLDMDALRAEGERQGSVNQFGTIGDPLYFINGKRYTFGLTVEYFIDGDPRVIPQNSFDYGKMTDAARRKLSEFFNQPEARAALLGDKHFHARHRYHVAEQAAQRTDRGVTEAEKALREAQQEHISACSELVAARVALEEMEAGE